MEEVLQELYCFKLDMEITAYKRKILSLESDEIYRKAYEIDSMINLYEFLVEKSQEIEEETLKKMLVFPNLLTFFYDRWLKRDDTVMDDFRESIKESISEITEIYKKAEMEVKTA